VVAPQPRSQRRWQEHGVRVDLHGPCEANKATAVPKMLPDVNKRITVDPRRRHRPAEVRPQRPDAHGAEATAEVRGRVAEHDLVVAIEDARVQRSGLLEQCLLPARRQHHREAKELPTSTVPASAESRGRLRVPPMMLVLVRRWPLR